MAGRGKKTKRGKRGDRLPQKSWLRGMVRIAIAGVADKEKERRERLNVF
jgi:hypothetical protein